MMDQTTIDTIQVAMRAAFPRVEDPALVDYYGMMEYHLGWRDQHLRPEMAETGKLVRPMLALLSCRALGGDPRHALPLAAALQLLHDFSLIHDDIEDHSAQRRGRATVWSIWGLEIGINVGDGMFAIAHRALHALVDVGVQPVTALEVLREFEETILRICEGQHLDMTGEGRIDITEARYLTMIRGKTAALLRGATALGARLATDDKVQIDAMGTFGEALGLAFQIHDDLLDIWGDPKQTGKPFAADLLQRKMSLPVIHAYARGGSGRATIERIYGQDQLSSDDVSELLDVLEASGSRNYVAQLAQEEHDRALTALAQVQPSDVAAYELLQQLAASMVKRAR